MTTLDDYQKLWGSHPPTSYRKVKQMSASPAPNIPQKSTSIPERFHQRRSELLILRHTSFEGADFASWDGVCKHRNIHKPGEPRCHFDLVAHYGEEYPVVQITGCPSCGSSYTD